MKRTFVLLFSTLLVSCTSAMSGAPAPTSSEACTPLHDRSLRFAVIGDSGTGGTSQREVGVAMADARKVFPFEFVLMLGDNLYGSERPQDYVKKFELPYKVLLDQGVKFYASLGNHDDQNQRYYQRFNMNGERYYAFDHGPVRFFALDTNYMDKDQLAWLERELRSTSQPWKVAFFHHPLYSSGAKHGAREDLREHLEPLFSKYGVSVVFAGHEHFYERMRPQKGIYYFTSGAAAKLRSGNILKTELTAKGLDTEYSFMLVEVTDKEFSFQTLTRTGALFDSGVFARPAWVEKTNGSEVHTAEDPRPLVCKPAA